ncbi:hypothetical protein [Mucilaginibacter sp.]|uniref:hypothetical protein n=1 Tax=Mucilaginibacter sp. TaxID=1882438 RepID=UPI00374CB34E
MRKLGAIGLAAFYLLLTTGMFVCLVHCSAEYLFAGSGNQLTAHDGHDDDGDDDHATSVDPHQEHHQGKEHGHKKSCGEGSGCSCCNQHGSYVVKENVNEPLNHQLTVLQVAFFPISYQLLSPGIEIYQRKISWLNGTGPPRGPDQPLYISYRSILI